MEKRNHGFSLTELLIVIAIIGMLAVIALPFFQGYMVRARLVEIEHGMTILKSAVSVYRFEKETIWPNCPDINAIRNSLGVALGAIGRASSMSVDPTTGTITATVQNVSTMVDGKMIMLRPVPAAANDGSYSWVWEYGPGFPAQFKQRGR